MSADIMDTAIKYIKYKERSGYEVMKMLSSKDYTQEEINDAINYLTDLHYIDEERFCETFIRYGISKGWGPVKIKHELKQKGLKPELMNLILNELYDCDLEKDNARIQAIKILENNKELMDEGINDNLNGKIGRRLTSLGYHQSVIYYVLNTITKCLTLE